jgi:hypothetical protein
MGGSEAVDAVGEGLQPAAEARGHLRHALEELDLETLDVAQSSSSRHTRAVIARSREALGLLLAATLRDPQRTPIRTTRELCERINQRLPALGYDQHCAIDGPHEQLDVVRAWLPTSWLPGSDNTGAGRARNCSMAKCPPVRVNASCCRI